MPPTDDQGRFVAIKLGLPEHTVCEFPANWQTHQGDDADWCEHGRRFPHRDYPDFLSPAGADLLLRTLTKDLDMGWAVCVSPTYLIIHDRHGTNRAESLTGVHQDWKTALRDAAYRLLKALEEK